jgi:hypothetical protein
MYYRVSFYFLANQKSFQLWTLISQILEYVAVFTLSHNNQPVDSFPHLWVQGTLFVLITLSLSILTFKTNTEAAHLSEVLAVQPTATWCMNTNTDTTLTYIYAAK